MSNAIQMNSGNVKNTPRDFDDIRLHQFLYQSGPIGHSTINIDYNSNLKKSDEWNKLYTSKTK